MSFEDIIDYHEELFRKKSISENELNWNPHLKDKFNEVLHGEERWLWKSKHDITMLTSVKPKVTLGQSLSESALKSFAWKACNLSRVERILVLQTDKDEFDIWTVITDFDEETEERLAQAEVELVRNNPDLKFDFMVIPRRGRDLAHLLPQGEVLYSKK